MIMRKLVKSILLIVATVAMTSCNGVVGYEVQKSKIDNGTCSYNDNKEVDNDTIYFVINKQNQMLMKATVNGVEDTVLYDSGCGSPAIQFYTKESQPEGMKFYRIPLMGADKKTKVNMSPIPVHIETPMCVVDHYGNAMLIEQAHSCDNEPSVFEHTILGYPGLDYVPFSIDFTNNRIYYIQDMSVIDSLEYIPVKCKLDNVLNILFIYPIINGVEYECVFDTGNDGGILIKDEQRIENHAEADLLYEGSYGIAVGGITEKQHFVVAPENTVEFAGREETVPVMYLGENLAFNNVGIQYIKRFDWVIGHQVHFNENHVITEQTYKLYAKPHVSDTIVYPTRNYALTTSDGTLKITTRLLDGHERFEVGDQIVSVDGENITEENICYYYVLLTETKDWSGFDIKVK